VVEMGTIGKSARYWGAHNPSVIVGLQQPLRHGVSLKKTVTAAGKGLVMPSRLRGAFVGGDIWPNTEIDCAAKERKCFYNPKEYGR